MKQIKNNTVTESATILEVVKKIDNEKLNSIVVLDKKKKVLGIFTLGDFRRAVFNGLDINSNISLILNKNFEYLLEGFLISEAKKIFNRNKLILDIPILKKNFNLLKIISREDIFSSSELRRKKISLKNLPVVIMAGGKGVRLDPFTRVLPKALIPIGNDPIMKIIMDNFIKFSSNNFYISLNEKANMIKAYLSDYKYSHRIKYIEEKKPLGTAGSLRLLKNNFKTSFFVTNCDIIIDSHYPSILEFHEKNNYDLTLIASHRSYKIPYGVCSIDKNGELNGIKEKPHQDLFVNTGFYIIRPRVLKIIPPNINFDMNELINKAKKNNMKIGVFPISENSWIDIGQLTEYKKLLNKINLI
jgi:dTDP-glucose pyrophosphorylase